MVSNVCVICPGCDSGVRIRIAVGHEDVQRFYMICPHCGSALRCRLTTDSTEGTLVGLEVDDRRATLTEWVDSPVVTVFTDLPIDPMALSMADPGGSPFLMHMQHLGEPFHAWLARRGVFEGLVRQNWADVVRWWGFYVRRDWPRFDHHAREYWSDEWPESPTAIDRHEAIHRALQVILAQLFARRDFVNWKLAVFETTPSMDWPAASAFSREWGRPSVAADAQAKLFDVLDQLIQQRWNLYPGLLLGEYEEHGVPFDSAWRVTRDDFRELRDLFGTTFERSHHYLPVLMSFDNALRRGGQDRYPDGQARTQTKLHKGRAVDREAVLELYAGWGSEIVRMLDRQLRNGIAHSTSHHDLTTGRVVGPQLDLAYPSFIAKVADATQVPLLLLEVLKYVLILQEVGDPS